MPEERKRKQLLVNLQKGYPAAVAEEISRVDPNTTQFLLGLCDTEIDALSHQLALNRITEEEFIEKLQNDPIISWGLQAQEALQNTIKLAYDNVNKSIRNGNVASSKWFINRHILTEKDKALLELLKMRAHNERLAILTRLKEHSQSAYRAALESMGLENDTSTSVIRQVNQELRREEQKIVRNLNDRKDESTD